MSTDNGEVMPAGENLAGQVVPSPVVMPTVGRMVYYKARGSADGVFPKVDRAAIITDVKENQVRLAVMNPEGLFFSGWLDQGQEGGQWDWMPFQKDQQARLAKEVS